jgi:acyl carrier protein
MDITIDKVKAFVLDEFLPGEDPAALTPTTPLITGGILDSIATLKLVAFLEETYHIQLEPHEVDADNLDSLELIQRLITSKMRGAS